MSQLLTLTYNFLDSRSKKALWQGWNKNTLSEVFFRSKLNVSGLSCLHHKIHFIVTIIQNNRKLIVASFFNSDHGHGKGKAEHTSETSSSFHQSWQSNFAMPNEFLCSERQEQLRTSLLNLSRLVPADHSCTSKIQGKWRFSPLCMSQNSELKRLQKFWTINCTLG